MYDEKPSSPYCFSSIPFYTNVWLIDMVLFKKNYVCKQCHQPHFVLQELALSICWQSKIK